jgi:adenosylmethionine-8-amino-7-oxononanoate aminotransferase
MSPANEPSLLERDARVSWHPYTQHALEDPPLPVAAARGTTLVLEDGRELLDGISSWWACLHGHGREELVEAMERQGRELDHVLFAGTTHEPAVRLAEALADVAPAGLSRTFYSDNGSTAVEIALKMAFQRHVHAGEPQRRVFVALEGSYHGDTFGAMSVGDPDPFFLPFAPLLFRAERVRPVLGAIPQALERLGASAAGVLVEPLLQGAAGMRMYPAEVLREARAACDAAGLPLIADEVLTGFGRAGALFACQRADVAPDLMAVAKGLTGGSMPLAATLATEEVYESFLSEDRSRAFFHGHTFTAHPIGCAVALAALEINRREDTPARLEAIGGRIEARLREHLADRADALDLRRLGGVVALDLPPPEGEGAGYLVSHGLRLRREAIARGVLLRPLGNVLYAMPPASATGAECERIADVMAELVALE